MKILIIGQTTLHWGRMEFGNIGNYYIIEPFVRMLHQVFPDASIKTTLQLSNRFCKDERIEVLPMELYYSWENDRELAEKELNIALDYQKTGILIETTAYISEVGQSNLVIDLSGDIWGDNADLLGDDRFFVGLCKDRVAQIFAKKTVMLAGSPGPFENQNNLTFAKEVYRNFDLVTNREPISCKVMESYGFDLSNTKDFACPSFSFEPASSEKIENLPDIKELLRTKRIKVGLVLCGWNFLQGPFDKWIRPDKDYDIFSSALNIFLNNTDVDLYLLSHSNGFPIPPKAFELKHGRDYPIIKQLQSILIEKGWGNRVFSLDGIYNAWQTKAIIGNFDMLVSGRVHAAVSGLSQCIPTVIIDYGHEPKAHKLSGFASLTNSSEYIADPQIDGDLLNKMEKCFINREGYTIKLKEVIPIVKALAFKQFQLLSELF